MYGLAGKVPDLQNGGPGLGNGIVPGWRGLSIEGAHEIDFDPEIWYTYGKGGGLDDEEKWDRI